MPAKPFLLMQTGDAPEAVRARHGNYDAMFLAAADFSRFELRVARVFEGEEPEAPQNYCGVLVTGSPAMLTDEAAWMEKSADWLREAVRAQVPVLGVCFGHQLIARALGGSVGFHPLGTELGTHEVTLYPGAEPHPWLADLPASFSANLAHSQTVRGVYGLPFDNLWEGKEVADCGGEPAPGNGPCASCKGCIRPRILACSGHDPHQIVAYGDKCLTLQFHPEFDEEIMQSVAGLYAGESRVRTGGPITDTPYPVSILKRFLEAVS